MLRYILRRVAYMAPTVFGVVLITFVLFNIAGGDPAKLKLGKQATPRTLEDYDRQRGYDKPLLFGLWGGTRAHADTAFDRTPGAWRDVPGLEHRGGPDGRVVLAAAGEPRPVPLAFDLPPGERYRWRFEYRLRAAAEKAAPAARWRVIGGAPEGAGEPAAEMVLKPAEEWRHAALAFETPEDGKQCVSQIVVERGRLELRQVRLRRRAAHVFDSQFWFYLRQLARLDFGVSHETNQKVSRMILHGMLPSLSLTVPMFLVGLVTAVSLALVCAFFRNTFIDRFLVVFSVVLMSVNYLVWIVLGQYILGYRLHWFPVWGYESWRYLVLPCLIGVVSGLGGSLRFYRTVMLEEVNRDYVRTAFAKGVGRGGVLFGHVLKNAMIPILTSVVLTIPFLFTGSLLLESFFGIPGLGSMAWNGINNSDVDVIRALVLVGALLYVVANLVTDISYAMVDPRVRLR